MKNTIGKILILSLIPIFGGCSQESKLIENFNLKQGSFIEINIDIKIKYSSSGIYLNLKNIPENHISRDFSDYMEVLLYDSKGVEYKPKQIYDVNGARRDIRIGFSNYPKGTRFKKLKIVALKDLEGTLVRWWTGELK